MNNRGLLSCILHYAPIEMIYDIFGKRGHFFCMLQSGLLLMQPFDKINCFVQLPFQAPDICAKLFIMRGNDSQEVAVAQVARWLEGLFNNKMSSFIWCAAGLQYEVYC